MTSSRLLPVVLGLALLAAACGTTAETTTSADTSDTATTAAASSTTTTSAETATGTDLTTTTTIAATTTTLAGVPTDLGPASGDVLAVVGIAYDDMLNVRATPGAFNPILDTIEPTGTVTATGTARDLGRAIWFEHDTGDAVGWSNLSFAAYAGGTDDATAEVVSLLGEIPIAESMDALGLIVARSLASSEPASRIVMSVAPTQGELGEVTYDVIDLGDDSVYGYRLHIFGEEVTDGFSLNTVERTALCSRGVDADGLCV
ncbi:MAG: hypothetical protein IH850_09535 [Acidobacteria bacterium]|nr:hypothetical protein [Acidobacteriota bacterium]